MSDIMYQLSQMKFEVGIQYLLALSLADVRQWQDPKQGEKDITGKYNKLYEDMQRKFAALSE